MALTHKRMHSGTSCPCKALSQEQKQVQEENEFGENAEQCIVDYLYVSYVCV